MSAMTGAAVGPARSGGRKTAALWGRLRVMCLLALGAVGLQCAGVGIAAAAEPGSLSLGNDGRVHLRLKGRDLCSFTPLAADNNWRFSSPVMVKSDAGTKFLIRTGAGIQGATTLAGKDGAGEAVWTFSSEKGVMFNALAVSAELSIATLAGGKWKTDAGEGVFPAQFGDTYLHNRAVTQMEFTTADDRAFTLSFPQPTPVMIQDNRKWGGQSFTVRIGRPSGQLVAGENYVVAMTIRAPEGLTTQVDSPVTIEAGADWIPLKADLEIQPGSALDFSGNGFTYGPCGSKGRIIVNKAGRFALDSAPDQPLRFYGANLCFTAHYLSKEAVDAMLDRWLRMGYNTLRIHHYEMGLTKPDWKPGLEWDEGKLDQLCYLIAGCAKRGIWLTTDLYVSRPIAPEQVGLPAAAPYINSHKLIDPQVYKALVQIHEPAYKDWQAFSKKLLEYVNPYTGKRLADEPAMAWISLINEGSLTLGQNLRVLPQWKTAWNQWLLKKFPDRAALAKALGDLKDNEDAGKGTVLLPAADLTTEASRARLCQMFLADTERAMVAKMTKFLRDEIKCPALLTNHNCGPNTIYDQGMRADLDYVDDHFYVDHPSFIEHEWRLPSRCPNANPVREGAPGGAGNASLRIWGKPFTISEFNYSGPGKYRGVGGVLTGALGALQEWDILWRFAYAHGSADVISPQPMDYFNLSRDPLNMVADRAAVALFLRGDLQGGAGAAAMQIEPADLENTPRRGQAYEMGWLAWMTRVGTALPGTTLPKGAVALPLGAAKDSVAALAALKAGGIKGEADDVLLRSDTGEILIDKSKGVLVIDTPRSAGGYADEGGQIDATKAGVRVDVVKTGATVFVMSVDRTPIRKAPRLLVTHLTDLQNTGTRYAEGARQTLLEWGKLPYLVQAGEATVRIALDNPQGYAVWALATGGKRLEKLPSKVENGALVFTLAVKGSDGARLSYEVARD